MNTCFKNIIKCLADGTGVFTFLPTTTTSTQDPNCYLVDCDGNFLVDCQCNYLACGSCVPVSSTTTSTTTTAAGGSSTSTTSSTTTAAVITSTSTSTSTSTTSSTTTSPSISTSTTTTGAFTPLVVPEGANLVSFGDSITTSNYVPLGNLYSTLLANDLGIVSIRYARGSTGFKTLMRYVHQGCVDGICQTPNSPMTPNTNVVTELCGLNDVYYEGNLTNNLPIVRHGVNTLLSIQWAANVINGANSSIVRTGTFADYTAKTNLISGRYGTTAVAIPNVTNAVYSNTPGSYAEYTATFKHAFVALIGSGGQYSPILGIPAPSGVVNIYVNGVLQTTIDLGDQYPTPQTGPGDGFGPDTQTVGPVLVPIIMPSSASRTIKIELVSGDMAIDYISILNNPASCYPAVLGEIPYVDPLQWGVGSPAIADQYSNEKLTIVNTWKAQGFPIAYADVNTYYNYVNTTDGTHPNVLGNQQVAQAFQVLFV